MLKRWFKRSKFVVICSNDLTSFALKKKLHMESDTGKGNYELDIILTPWMILSSDTSFVITADTVSTICEPIPSVKEMYLNKTTASMEVEEEVPLSETEVLNG